LAFEDEWADVVSRDFTSQELADICNNSEFVFGDCSQPINVIIDLRPRNLAVVAVNGLDFNLQYGFKTRIGRWSLNGGGTLVFHYDRQVTDKAPRVDVVDTVGNQLALRARGGIDWSSGRWRAGATVNYVGDYRDRRTSPATRIGDWTTVDAHLSYSIPKGSNLTDGIEVSLGIVNLFNKRPPFVDQALSGIGYDAANANLIGRLASFQLRKSW
jgi:outer membrane receptor protein involved in Fe transport